MLHHHVKASAVIWHTTENKFVYFPRSGVLHETHVLFVASNTEMVFTQACQREFEVCGLHGRRLLVGCWWKLGWGLFLKYSDLLWFPLKWPAKIKGRGKNLRLFSLVYCCQRYLKSFQRFFLPFFFLHVVNSGHACIWRLSKDKLEKLSSLKKQQKLCFDVLGASTAASPQRASIVLAPVKQLFVGPHYKTKNRSDFQMKNKSKNMAKEIASTYLSICKDQEKKGICDGVSSLPPELTAQRWQLHGMAPERAGQVGFDIPCIPCANPRGQQKVSHCNQGELAQSKHRARPKPLTSLPKKKGKKLEYGLPYITALQTLCPHGVLQLAKSWQKGITQRTRGRLNDIRRTLQAAFHVFSCVPWTAGRGNSLPWKYSIILIGLHLRLTVARTAPWIY